MKKQLIAGLAGGAVAVAGFVTVAPYFLGLQAEKALTEQQAILARSSILSVESHRYERGWFSSTETLVVRLKPTLLSNAQQYLPDSIKDRRYYEPGDNKNEQAFAQYWKMIKGE